MAAETATAAAPVLYFNMARRLKLTALDRRTPWGITRANDRKRKTLDIT
jgi:hypothetical protein